MHFFIVPVLLWLPAEIDESWGLDPGLLKEIREWEPGSPPPARLLRFPHGHLPELRECGVGAIGDSVSDYINQVDNVQLLEAMMLDWRADASCFHAAVRRLLMLKGIRHLKSRLAERRKTDPTDFDRPELATLNQLLASPYVRLKAASLAKKDAEEELAMTVLNDMRSGLLAGRSWDDAYRKAAQLLSDRRGSQPEKGRRTLLSYEYDGFVAPTGFDLAQRRIIRELRPVHLEKVFHSKRGVLLLETDDNYWLYQIEELSD